MCKGISMKKFILLVLMSSFAASISAEEGFASLEEQMTGAEFMASGLSKLTPEELEALNNWIRARTLATLDQPKSGTYAYSSSADSISPEADMRGFENKENSKSNKKNRVEINSRLIGMFSGWDGNTLFKLDNGMIWAQTSKKDKFYIEPIENPAVTIEPGMFGTWRLHVEDYATAVKVERIQ
jgi:hypothetical protein